ncbi:MAG: type II toxin-antitoxin system VapC family toxin [Pirellulales bacterium]|nr:type II toxin-antitoxin system VapC family toxin [Pirellulales bacterium]
MKPKVYVETTVLGYLTSWPSGDLVVAGRQKITRDWWQYAVNAFEMVVSELVHREASAGDPEAIRDRLEALKNLPIVAISQPAENLASALLAGGAVPSTEPEDALHIALAVVNGMEYLVTWNFKHIANAAMRSKIQGVCIAEGYSPCTICTPEELLEPESDV